MRGDWGCMRGDCGFIGGCGCWRDCGGGGLWREGCRYASLYLNSNY